MTAWVYMLRCADGSYYIGCTTKLEQRLHQHSVGATPSYTSTRLPIEVVYVAEFQRIHEAIAAERQMKRWSRAKKEAVIRNDWDALPMLAKRGFRPAANASFETAASRPPQDDELG